MRFTCKEVEAYKKFISYKAAESYMLRVNKEIANYGLDSMYIQTQYFCSFDVVGDRFLTDEMVETINLYNCNGGIDMLDDGDRIFRIGSLDSSRKDDYCVLSVGDAKIMDESTFDYITSIREVIIMNPSKERLGVESIVSSMVDTAKRLKLDYLMIDATAGQFFLAMSLYLELKKANISTQLVPLIYSQQSKMDMFSYFEKTLFDRKINLPIYEYSSQSFGLIQLRKELSYFKKEIKTGGKVSYAAPNGTDFYDDAICSTAQLVYCLQYINQLPRNKKLIEWGDGHREYLTISKAEKGEHKLKRARSYLK